ncbi:ABC transporter ATP-binding protein [Erythrobacter insulae]|uniref:ABC transporter ATP-binding protein n=1 Tax=Erythrobacter insulae TaxID=2584124 RepID=A0A547PBZ2_9SPHN|nr:ABC transporter ATP-binding protein [Erythrobacter insulae]TRD11655.1 ABC transporter ATP-binding protein [Erythrobacter insulae]
MTFEFLWQRAKQFRAELLLISGLTLLGSLATLAIPWLAGQVIGGMVTGQSQSLDQTLYLLILALVAMTGLSILSTIASSAASLRILTGLRQEIYDHVSLMPMSFHEKRSSGDLLALMTYEVGNLSSFLATTLATAPSMLLTAGGAVIVLFLINPYVAVLIPILLPLFFVAMKLVGRRLRILARQARRAEVAVFATAESDLAMIPAIKAFASEEDHRTRYSKTVLTSQAIAFRKARIRAFISPIVALISALAAIAVLALGSTALASGEQSPGELFAFLLYAALLTRPVGGLADIYGRYQTARGTLSRLQSVLEMELESGHNSGITPDRANGRIELQNVHFTYPGRPAVLCGLDLQIQPGEIIALTGDNGVGKSTLVKLLLRFYAPDSGQILLDGQDIGALQIQSLRRQFGYVPQRALLFNGTIADNIAFGQDRHSDDNSAAAIARAVRLAQAERFISDLPQGLETEIGDHGIRLSGGQGQRVALARALYRDPPIYILDEATSMYDLDSEAAFVEDCIEALKGRTVIIITHRPASLALADRVLKVSADAVTDVTGAL